MAVQTITYGDKSYLNQNADIPATNKVQDTDMNEIKRVVNNNATELTNIKNAEIYSTDEIKTNKIWIDGKPIYRKVISATSPSSVNIWVGVGSISNLSVLISINGTLAGTTDGRILPINYPEPSYEIVTTVLRESVQMRTATPVFTSKPCHIILEYTKTS